MPLDGTNPQGRNVLFDALARRVGIGLLDPAARQHQIVETPGQPGVGRRAVAAGAADFLVIGFDGFWQVGMGDPAYIWFVDAHSEGHRGADN